MFLFKLSFFLLVFLNFHSLAISQNKSDYSHGIAMHGDLKYKKNFKHFEYANPDAPKGGEIKLSSIGTFDNLNPYIH